MRTCIKGLGLHGSISDENGKTLRSRGSLVRVAKELRQCMTPAETLLWGKLRGKKLHGHKFYRQVPIDWYVVDFYCPSQKLVIEIDGGIHDEKDIAENDRLRERRFRERGLRILHISNENIFSDIGNVCERIRKACLVHVV